MAFVIVNLFCETVSLVDDIFQVISELIPYEIFEYLEEEKFRSQNSEQRSVPDAPIANSFICSASNSMLDEGDLNEINCNDLTSSPLFSQKST